MGHGIRSSGTEPFFFIIPKPGSRDFLPPRGVYCVLQPCEGILRRTRGLEKRAGAARLLLSLNIVRNTLDCGEREREKERLRLNYEKSTSPTGMQICTVQVIHTGSQTAGVMSSQWSEDTHHHTYSNIAHNRATGVQVSKIMI